MRAALMSKNGIASAKSRTSRNTGFCSVMPMGPLVRNVISLMRICTIVPKARVTIARYGPVTCRAGRASIRPNSTDTRMPKGSAATIPMSYWKFSTPAV